MKVLIIRNKETGYLEMFTKKKTLLGLRKFEADRERRLEESIPEQCIHRLYGDTCSKTQNICDDYEVLFCPMCECE